MLKEFLITKSLDEVYSFAKKQLTSNGQEEVKFTKSSILKSINEHTEETIKWSKEASVNVNNNQEIENSYVDLKYYLTPKMYQTEGTEEVPEKILFKDYLAKSDKNTIILGQPGAGKTTSLQHISYNLMTNHEFCDKFSIPVVIRFRELKQYGSTTFKKYEGIYEKLYKIFGLYGLEKFEDRSSYIIENTVCKTLNELNILLILDGFDEYPYPSKEKIVNEIKSLARKLTNSKFILTSRTVEFPYLVNNSKRFEIAELDNEQIKFFSKKWLNSDEDSTRFCKQIFKSTYLDTARRPLTLVHLLIIFKNTKPKQIPLKPNLIYSKVVDLLIHKWDLDRNIIRESKYSTFFFEQKKSFLCKLSFYLTKKYYSSSFGTNSIRSTYIDLCESFNLPKDEVDIVLKELESHNGLFIKSSENKYEFAHKSIQEYFTAEYLKGVPVISNKHINLLKIPNELAILVALSTEPNDFIELIFATLFKDNFDVNFLDTFLNRVHLENPNFLVEPKLGYYILFAYNDILKQNNKNPNDKIFTNCLSVIENMILENRTISKSIYSLEKYYRLIDSDGNSIINESIKSTQIDLENHIVTIIPKVLRNEKNNFSGELNCPLKFLKEWRYVAPLY